VAFFEIKVDPNCYWLIKGGIIWVFYGLLPTRDTESGNYSTALFFEVVNGFLGIRCEVLGFCFYVRVDLYVGSFVKEPPDFVWSMIGYFFFMGDNESSEHSSYLKSFYL